MPTATRSQLTLPELNFIALADFPPKNVRQATQNSDRFTRTMHPSHQPAELRSSDDAHHPASKHLKRASSSNDEMFAEKLDERVTKRPKMKDADLPSSNSPGKSVSTSSSPSPKPPASSSTAVFPRAHSVPAESVVPHLDLNHVPPSPSKSKGKEILRYTSLPPEEVVSNPPASSGLPSVHSGDQDVPMAEAIERPCQLPATSHAGKQPTLDIPMSPLTPLPSTPWVHQHKQGQGEESSYEEMAVQVHEHENGGESSRPPSRSKTPTPTSRLPRPSTAVIAVSAKKGIVARMKPKTPSISSTSAIPAAEPRPSTILPPKTPTRGRPQIGAAIGSRTPSQIHSSTPGPSRAKPPASVTAEVSRPTPRTPGPPESVKAPRPKILPASRSVSQAPGTSHDAAASKVAVHPVIEPGPPVLPETPARASSIPRPKTPRAPSPVPTNVDTVSISKDVPQTELTGIPAGEPMAQAPIEPSATVGLSKGPVSLTEQSAVSARKDDIRQTAAVPLTDELPKKSLPRKRSASAAPETSGGVRMTRSASLRHKENTKGFNVKGKEREVKSSEVSGAIGSSQGLAVIPFVDPTKTPMRGRSSTFSVTRPTLSSAAKTNTTSPVKPRPPASMASSRPSTSMSISRTSSTSSRPSNSTSSVPSSAALSTLSLALEKLNMPPPSRPSMGRPNTSLGFNPDKGKGVVRQDADSEDDSASKMDEDEDGVSRSTSRNHPFVSTIGTSSAKTKQHDPAEAAKSTPLRRANTVEPASFSSASRTENKQSTLMLPPPVPKPKPSTSSSNGEVKAPITLSNGIVSGRARGGYVFGNTKTGTARGIFGVAPLPPSMQSGISSLGRGRVVHRASKQTSLPAVQGSPVKGADADEDVRMDESAVDEDDAVGRPTEESNPFVGGPSTPPRATPVEMVIPIRDVDGKTSADANVNCKEQEKNKPSSGWKNQSRRASQAHQFLSESLSSLPQTPPRKKAPATDGKGKGRATDSESSTNPKSAPGGLGGAAGIGARVSTRRAAAVTAATALSPPRADKKAKNAPGSSNGSSSKPKTLKILRHCNVFVDVRTDDGDDAGSLFVEMLRGLGARILGRVGQSCTHIVYKKGLMSTLTRFRQLDNPKPAVVGIGWVVECVERRARVEEKDFLIDIELASIAGSNKRRRSMLPKHLLNSPERRPHASAQSSDGGRPSTEVVSSPSSEGTVANNSLDSLPPLERARLRQSQLFGR